MKILCPDDEFLELHSRATEKEKDEIWAQKNILQQVIKTRIEFSDSYFPVAELADIFILP